MNDETMLEQEQQAFLLDTLQKLLGQDSPSGFTHKATALAKDIAQGLGFEARLTNKGNLVVKVPGREAGGVHFAVDYLAATTRSLLNSKLKDGTYLSAAGKDVVVVGGGDTGNDCVGTALRHGCRSVVQLEMMPRLPDQRADDNRWPEWPRVCKTDYGQEEAVAVFGRDPRIYQTTVKELLTDSEGNLRAVKVVRLEAGTDKKTGRTVMHEVAGSEEELPCQLLLIAAGFLGPQAYVAETFGLERTPRSCVSTAPGGYATNVPKVFAAGDMRRGQSLVVWAIQEGRAAAHEVDTFLMGYSN